MNTIGVMLKNVPLPRLVQAVKWQWMAVSVLKSIKVHLSIIKLLITEKKTFYS